MVECIMGIGRTIQLQVKEYSHGLMEENMKVSLKILGEYKNDKKEGFGVYKWADGRRYEGMWKDGKQHGKGKFIMANGTLEGNWNQGQYIQV